jgi:hypothetical protein
MITLGTASVQAMCVVHGLRSVLCRGHRACVHTSCMAGAALLAGEQPL